MAEDEDQSKRVTHVERIYGKDKSKDGGEDNSDASVDVEMLDELHTFGWRTYINGQEMVREFVTDRKRFQREKITVKVTNHDDKNQFVELDVWTMVHSESQNAVRSHYVSKSPPDKKDNTEREHEVRKVIHRGIGEENMEGKEGKKQPPKDPKKYLEAIKRENDKDEDQYVKVDYAKQWKKHGMGRGIPGLLGQATKFDVVLRNSKLIPKADDEAVEKAEGKVVRTDPLQWIVNVDWSGLAVEFGDHAKDAPAPKKGET